MKLVRAYIHNNNKVLFLVLMLAFFFYTIFIYRTSFIIDGERYFTLIDDAMISMRYAKNLSDGYGLVWNPGESPVQGFTNMGWMFFMAILHLIPIPASKISLLVMVTAMVLLLGNALLAYRICDISSPQAEWSSLIAATIIAFYYPLVFWSLRGMEVAITTLLVGLSALLVIQIIETKNLKLSNFLGLVILMALLVRFDVIFQLLLVLLCLFSSCRNRREVSRVALPALVFIVAIAGILLFQYLYFGDIYPNAYYLKVEGVSYLDRLRLGILVLVDYASRDFLVPLLIAIGGLIFYQDLRKRENYLLLGLFLVQCIYSVYVGGDYAEPYNTRPQVEAANRFITQGMPALIILFSIAITRFTSDILSRREFSKKHNSLFSPTLAITISLATLLVISGKPWFKWTVHNAPLLDTDIWRTKLGVHIGKNTLDDATIAVHAAGQIPYYSNRNTIDLLGKNDPFVAKGSPASAFRPGHNKWNYEYSILILKPDLIADEWGTLRSFLSNNDEYRRLENGIHIRVNSSLNINDGLALDYR